MKIKKYKYKFVDEGSDNWNEREGNQQHEIGRQARMEEENKTLGTKSYENIDTLHKSISIYFIISNKVELICFTIIFHHRPI